MTELGEYEELFGLLGVRDIDTTDLRRSEWKLLPEPHREAAELSALIVQGRGVDLPASGRLRLPSFLLDMAEVFESYLRNVLRTGLSVGFEVLDGNKEGAQSLYDEKPSPLATPDIVFKRVNQTALVADVKYKSAPSREDVNQIVTYAVRYKIKKVLLLTLSSDIQHRSEQIGTISGIEVHSYGVCLAAADLDSEERELVKTVRDMISLLV